MAEGKDRSHLAIKHPLKATADQKLQIRKMHEAALADLLAIANQPAAAWRSREVQAFHGEVQLLRPKVQIRQRELQRLRPKVQTFHHELQTCQRSTAFLRWEMQSRYCKVQTLHPKVQSLHRKLQRLHPKVQTFHHELQTRQRSTAFLRWEVQSRYRKVQTLRPKVQSLHRKLQRLHREVQSLQRELQPIWTKVQPSYAEQSIIAPLVPSKPLVLKNGRRLQKINGQVGHTPSKDVSQSPSKLSRCILRGDPGMRQDDRKKAESLNLRSLGCGERLPC
jgi:ubiquinone biosynthesis protein UbiJ